MLASLFSTLNINRNSGSVEELAKRQTQSLEAEKVHSKLLEKQQNLGPVQRQSTDEKEIPADLFGTAAAFGWRVLISSSWGVVLV